MIARRIPTTFVLLALFGVTPFVRGQPASSPQFEKNILPILTARCVKCHGETKPRAKLDLRTGAGLIRGGESGPVLMPGSSAKSLLYEVIRKGEMPPAKEPQPTAQEVALLKAWIDAGAPGVQSSPEAVGRAVTDEDRRFWSFQKPRRPVIPEVRKSISQIRNPIDAFIVAKLEAKGLTLSPDADRPTLLRRVTFDLIGLPPTPEELAAFLADDRADAYERVVERLLSSPHYGERWGRHWLDAAGYSDTVGGDNDPGQVFPREGIWRYRDYVVRSLNDDKSLDRFLTEQIAGDELDDWRSAAVLTPTMREQLIATGFLRTTVDHTTEQELNRPFERYQVLHDSIEILTSNVLGLTVACARCHDHKFDPISQVDYYRLLAVLKPVYNPEQWIQPQNRHLPDAAPKEIESIDRQVAALQKQIAVLQRPPQEKRSLIEAERARLATLNSELAALNAKKKTFGKIQAAWEAGQGNLPVTHVFRRGNHVTPGAEVTPGVFAVLTDPKRSTLIPPPASGAKSSGRRTAWARWLTSPDHPLTARVFVNRLWQHHFGEGIVATSDNFGKLGAKPTHPELLDWLAVRFVEGGWKIKEMHRLMVTSSVYRQSSAHRPGAEKADPGNQLLWRMRLRRLESEAIRDAILSVSGRLDHTIGGVPVPIEPKTDGKVVIAEKGLPTATAQWRRSLYLFARRNYNLTLLGTFDQPVMATNCTRRVHSAVPLQSLTLLNDATLLEQADHFAARIAGAGSVQQQVQAAFRLAFSREATAKEVTSGMAFLERLRQRFAEEKLSPAQVELKALARLCHMLMCANEFLYVG